MADQTRQANVIRFTADGQTFTGPLKIIGIKFNNGANAQTVTIKDAATNALYAVQAGANVQQPLDCFGGAGWQLRSEQYTVAFSSTGGTLYLYCG
jgi:hypothetical protein